MSKSTKILSTLLTCSLALIAGLLYQQNSQSKPTSEANASTELSKYRELYAKPISEWEKPNLDETVLNEWQEFAPLPEISYPKDNAYSDVKAFLGKKLFNEPKLSKSGQISCQNCHHPELAFTDGLRLSYGHDRQRGRRNAPSILASAYFNELFWDGRAKSLEEQALAPMQDPVEMANMLHNVQKTIQNIPEYYPLFVASFGDEKMKEKWEKHFPQVFERDEKVRLRAFANDEVELNATKLNKFSKAELEKAMKLISIDTIIKAIATYERSIVPKNSRFNRFLQGDYRFLSDTELWGLDIFRQKGKCMNCHYGAILSDNKFHNIGLSFYGRKLQDLGRYEITQNIADVGKFKTPSLLGVSKTAPYMHNGIFPQLVGVINMYNAGFPVAVVKGTENDLLLPKTDPLIMELNLTREEILALEAFLKAL